MSWYATIEEAKKALKRKSKEFLEEYSIVKDSNIPRCYLVIKKVLQKDNTSRTPHADT